jgi:hypothetical protein
MSSGGGQVDGGGHQVVGGDGAEVVARKRAPIRDSRSADDALLRKPGRGSML